MKIKTHEINNLKNLITTIKYFTTMNKYEILNAQISSKIITKF